MNGFLLFALYVYISKNEFLGWLHTIDSMRISLLHSHCCAIGFWYYWDIHHTLVPAIFLETRLWVWAFGDPLHHGGHQSSFPGFTFHTLRAAQVFNTDQSQPLSCSFITRPQLFFFLVSLSLVNQWDKVLWMKCANLSLWLHCNPWRDGMKAASICYILSPLAITLIPINWGR